MQCMCCVCLSDFLSIKVHILFLPHSYTLVVLFCVFNCLPIFFPFFLFLKQHRHISSVAKDIKKIMHMLSVSDFIMSIVTAAGE